LASIFRIPSWRSDANLNVKTVGILRSRVTNALGNETAGGPTGSNNCPHVRILATKDADQIF